jgi:ribonuclease D
MMVIRYIDTERELEEAQQAMEGRARIALDLEAAGFHRYDDRLSLVQMTAGNTTFLLDPFTLPLGDFLRPVLESPDVQVVMHGSDYDLRLLDRDLSILPQNLFDTQVAALLLGLEGIGLSALLDRYFGVKLSKKFQRADWAIRPIPPEMREYAASDTMHLEALADLLREQLEAQGRLEWAFEEFEALRRIRFQENRGEDPVSRVKVARDLSLMEVARLREALEWRDTIARARDRAPFRVVQDDVLVSISRHPPLHLDALASVPGLNPTLAREEGRALLERLDRIRSTPVEQLTPYPRPPRGLGRGRPDPEAEERFLRLKEARNRLAERLKLDRGALIPNAVLQSMAESPPTARSELAQVDGLRRWQLEVAGDELWAALQGGPSPAASGG